MTQESGQLIVQLEGNVIQTVLLTETPLRVGRTPDNGLSLSHPLVARQHAELRLTAEGASITDLGSPQGTFVGGTRLLPNQPTTLTDGASFEIGPFVIVFRVPGHTQVAKPEPIQSQAEPHLVPPDPVPPYNPPPPPRASQPPLLAHGPTSRYLRDLPVVYHDDDFMARFLLIFESIWEPLEQRQDYIEYYFDARTCPAAFLPWLAGWLGITLNSGWPEARRRQLVASAMDIYRWRGTRYGLARMIEVCTGLTPQISEDPARPFVFQIRLNLPPGADIERDMIEDLVRLHKPAHVGYILEFSSS